MNKRTKMYAVPADVGFQGKSSKPSILKARTRFFCYNGSMIEAFAPDIRQDGLYCWKQIFDFFVEFDRRKRRSSWKQTMYFSRHGQTTYNIKNLVSGQSDCALTELGRIQAKAIASNLNEQADIVFCGTLSRSRETAELYVDETNKKIPIISDSRLNEISMGILEGKPRKEIQAFRLGDVDFRPKNGESYRQGAQRFASFLIDLAGNSEFKKFNRVLIVSHNGLLRIAISFFNEFEDAKDLFDWSLDNARLVKTYSKDVEVSEIWKKKVKVGLTLKGTP